LPLRYWFEGRNKEGRRKKAIIDLTRFFYSCFPGWLSTFKSRQKAESRSHKGRIYLGAFFDCCVLGTSQP
jgi:hypothetical protein